MKRVSVSSYNYVGKELEGFEKAVNWKAYWFSKITNYIQGDVLEVGAGIGANVSLLSRSSHRKLTFIEPDPAQCRLLKLKTKNLKNPLEIINGNLKAINGECKYDCIIYIDVLEHIEKDHLEFISASRLLRPDGYLIVLCPAFNFLFNPFDIAVGHFRRYNKKMYYALPQKNLGIVSITYLDSIGFFASLFNRFFLKSALPSNKQITFWDKYLVHLSKRTDLFLSKFLGKSILGIWKKF